jgi:PTH1 family peptidyl-tRNA hydrolase
MVADALAARCRASFAASGRALMARCRLSGHAVLVLKPQGYMNRSGEALLPVMREQKAGPDELVVVHDDLDLPLGRVKLYRSGGDGGHNGVASVIAALGTGRFVRVRVGIGRPPEGMDPADYVLSPFMPEELEAAREAVETAAQAVGCIVREGMTAALNRFNRRRAEGRPGGAAGRDGEDAK